MRISAFVLALAATSAAFAAESPSWATKDLRAGIIGTDTSHVPTFTGAFRSHPEWKIKVMAAFKAGSPDLPISADRVEGFAKTIHDKYGVELVGSIEELLQKVDVVLLESVDARPHLAQATPVLKAGKRLFIDKPLAVSLDDARRIVQLSKETGTPFFSSSSTRFHPEIPRLRQNPGVGKVIKVQGSSPLKQDSIPPRPVLLRNSRCRSRVRGNGNRMRQRFAENRERCGPYDRQMEGRPHRRLLWRS